MVTICPDCGAEFAPGALPGGCAECAAARGRRQITIAASVVGLVTAAAIAGGILSAREVPAAPVATVIVDVLPEGSEAVAGMSWSSLRASAVGQSIVAAILAGNIDEELLARAEAECEVGALQLFEWMARIVVADERGGARVVRFTASEDEVNSCLHQLADARGGDLAIVNQARLREYTYEGETAFAAWLGDDVALIVEDIDPERQSQLLHRLLDRDQPAASNRLLAELLANVDTSATFWLAMSKPGAAHEQDGAARTERRRWFREQVAGRLGSAPEGVYAALDIGADIVVTVAALYDSAPQAERVAERVRRLREAAADRQRLPTERYLGGFDYQLADRLQVGIAAAYERTSHTYAELLARVSIEPRGRFVVASLSLGADEVDSLLAYRPAAELLRLLNHYLPSGLQLPL